MYKLSMLGLVAVLAGSVLLAAPTRNYDDKGAPPFKVLKEGEKPPLDANENFVIGPKYVAAPERKAVQGVPQGKVQQFEIDSKETKLFNPGIKRDKFGTVDPITVLQALRADAWLHGFGDPRGADSPAVRAQVRAAFADDDPAWLAAVWTRFAEVMGRALAR